MAVLRFPREQSLGTVTIGRVGGEVVPAQGDVEYEPGTWMTLKLNSVAELGSLRQLPADAFRRVDFQHSEMNDDHLADACCLTGAERLVLEGSAVTDAGMTHLEKVTGLRRLFLDGCRVGDQGMPAISRIANLERLDLTNTEVTNEGVRLLAGMKQLQALMLEGTKVTDEVIDLLAPLESLKMVTLQGTSVTPAAVSRVARHPHLNVWIDDDTAAADLAELHAERPDLVINGVRHWTPTG